MNEISETNINELRERIRLAVFDPGHAGEGYKGDRTLAEWQYDAVMRVIETLNSCKDFAGDWDRMKAAAILAERERCAKACEGEADYFDSHIRFSDQGKALRNAAKLIRGEA